MNIALLIVVALMAECLFAMLTGRLHSRRTRRGLMSATVETRNAVIESAVITNDDHGVLSAWVYLDFGGSGQGFGGHVLYLPKDFKSATNQRNYAGHFIWRVMEIAGVHEWSKLAGKTVRARQDHSKVHAIGHIVRDDWFDIEVEFAVFGRAK